MWALLSLLCAGAGLLGPPACGAADFYASSLEKVHFKSWMVQHRKTYSSEEYQHRLQTFVGNWRRIRAHNAGNHTFKMALNQFSDMSFAEIKHKYLWSEPQNCSATRGNYLRGTGPYPPFVDWRKKGKFVSPVKNQGGCGSCWTFSTTGALESAIAIKSGKLLSLAEQQLVDCAQGFNNHGCQGGLPSQAFEYIRYNKGIMGEDTYPYKGQDGECKFQPSKAIAFVKDVANITLNDEEAMLEIVALYNPVSFAFEVTGDFMMYRKGVYSSSSAAQSPFKPRDPCSTPRPPIQALCPPFNPTPPIWPWAPPFRPRTPPFNPMYPIQTPYAPHSDPAPPRSTPRTPFRPRMPPIQTLRPPVQPRAPP
uniref:Cathepsin H n=1 Tax=Suricata suricatta TaxID=37032 RepID=A0A673TWP1_SURSU